MKKKILCVLVLTLCAISFLTSATISSPAATVKLIRNKVISTTELNDNVAQYKAQGVDVSTLQVLNAMINAEVFSQGAEKAGYSLTSDQQDALVAASKQNVESQLGSTLTDDQFKQVISQQTGLTMEDFKSYLTQQYIREQYVSEAEPDIINNIKTPTSTEVLSFFKQNAKEFFNPEAVKLSHIFIPISDDETENAKNLATLESVLSQINNRTITFEKAVTEYSQDADSNQKAGDIGWLSIDSTTDQQTMGEDFFNAAFALDAGEVSEVIKSNFGYHIIKVSAHTQSKLLGIDDKISPDDATTVRQYITSYLTTQNQQQAFIDAYNTLVAELRSEASVKILYQES